MNVVFHVRYPGNLARQVIQGFMSAEIPKRPEYVKELGSVAYYDQAGANAVFLFEVPDDKLAEYTKIQIRRNTYLSSRVNGYAAEMHAGLNVSDTIKEMMPLLPG